MPMPFGKINSLRASYYFYGSLLGRYGQATVGLPGGCDLGPRPIDLHLKAFEAMGAAMTMDGSSMKLATDGKPLQGVNIYMDTVSVGATINTILAAVKAEGRTVIENAAREPEIIDGNLCSTTWEPIFVEQERISLSLMVFRICMERDIK